MMHQYSSPHIGDWLVGHRVQRLAPFWYRVHFWGEPLLVQSERLLRPESNIVLELKAISSGKRCFQVVLEEASKGKIAAALAGRTGLNHQALLQWAAQVLLEGAVPVHPDHLRQLATLVRALPHDEDGWALLPYLVQRHFSPLLTRRDPLFTASWFFEQRSRGRKNHHRPGEEQSPSEPRPPSQRVSPEETLEIWSQAAMGLHGFWSRQSQSESFFPEDEIFPNVQWDGFPATHLKEQAGRLSRGEWSFFPLATPAGKLIVCARFNRFSLQQWQGFFQFYQNTPSGRFGVGKLMVTENHVQFQFSGTLLEEGDKEKLLNLLLQKLKPWSMNKILISYFSHKDVWAMWKELTTTKRMEWAW